MNKLTPLIVRAIGEALCQPNDQYTFSFGFNRPNLTLAHTNVLLQRLQINNVESKLVNGQVVLKYVPVTKVQLANVYGQVRGKSFLTHIPDEIQVAHGQSMGKTELMMVRGTPWSKRLIDKVVLFDEMDKYHNDIIEFDKMSDPDYVESDVNKVTCHCDSMTCIKGEEHEEI